MTIQADIFTTHLSTLGESPWDFSLTNGFTAYVAKEFKLLGGGPGASFIGMILLDTDGGTATKVVSVPVSAQFPNGTQGSPAVFNRDQLQKVTWDFTVAPGLNMSSIHKITIRFLDVLAGATPLYCFIDQIEAVKI